MLTKILSLHAYQRQLWPDPVQSSTRAWRTRPTCRNRRDQRRLKPDTRMMNSASWSVSPRELPWHWIRRDIILWLLFRQLIEEIMTTSHFLNSRFGYWNNFHQKNYKNMHFVQIWETKRSTEWKLNSECLWKPHTVTVASCSLLTVRGLADWPTN
jgi:hypothetical protein